MIGYLWVLVPFLGLGLGAAILAWVNTEEGNPLVNALLAFFGTQAAAWIFVLWVL